MTLPASAQPQNTTRSRQIVSREEVVATNGAVAATRYHEAAAGVACLQDGGSAVDAAVAAAFIACVIEPFSTSIGGCGFMLVSDRRSGERWSIEFPPKAPLAARADMYTVVDDAPGSTLGTLAVAQDANTKGYLAATVPATVAGLVEAHRRFGRLPLQRVIDPAVGIARRGFRSDLYYEAIATAYRPILRRCQKSASALLVNGEPPVSLLGQRLPQPDLADALEQIGRDGGESFYRGDIARALVHDVVDGGGIMGLDDLATYRPIVTRPFSGWYRGHEVSVPTSPSGGWTVLQTLAILERFDLPSLARDSAERIHIVIEALRHAFADRYVYLGDPDHALVPLTGLLCSAYVDELAGLIDPAHTDSRLYPERQPWAAFLDAPLHDPWRYVDGGQERGIGTVSDGGRHGTVHVCAADGQGLVVSCTHTHADIFGAKCMAGPGILLNNGMQWFSPRPGGANSIAGGKRPMANMAPLIAHHGGRPVLAAGAFGGRRIISAMVQIVSDSVDHGLSPQQACEAPRIDASERTTFADERLGADVLDRLRDGSSHRDRAGRPQPARRRLRQRDGYCDRLRGAHALRRRRHPALRSHRLLNPR